MRFPWQSPAEAIFDLLLDEYYVDHPNRDALLSNEYDFIGIACNCHARFGQICVFEMITDAIHSGKVVPLNPCAVEDPVARGTCLEQCYNNATTLFDTRDNNGIQTQQTYFTNCCDLVCKEYDASINCATEYTTLQAAEAQAAIDAR